MAQRVKCKYCGKIIDKEVDFTYSKDTSGRYYHDECYKRKKAGGSFKQLDKKKKEEPNTRDLIHQKIKTLCGDAYVKTRVENQIKENRAQGRTLEGILKTLEYWYDVQKHDPKEAYGGIGIVEYIYPEAQKYFSRKEELKKQCDATPQSTIDSIKQNMNAFSKPCTIKEKTVRPRNVAYFDLK